ncbi:MAG: prolyl oligopeptidase family serine peptidase [Acidobacteria bacterium]|nr:prolyl oligopeptidase family serine peptidase [Acidobacteriota bacterium]
MFNKPRFLPLVCGILLLFFGINSPVPADEKDVIHSVITEWLLLGPFQNPLPAFHGDTSGGFDQVDLLLFDELDISRLKPAANRTVIWNDGSTASWKTEQTEKTQLVIRGAARYPSVAYAAVYIAVDRWTQAKLTITTPQTYNLYLDGSRITQKKIYTSAEEGEGIPAGRNVTTDLLLETGKHCLIIKTVHHPSTQTDWQLNAVLSYNELFAKDSPPRFVLSPRSHMQISHLLDGPKAAGVTISPDASLGGIFFSQSRPDGDRPDTWMTIYNLKDGSVYRTFRETGFSDPTWSPDNSTFAYTTRNDDGTTLWLHDRISGETSALLKNLPHFGSFVWAPDSRSIVYSATFEGKEDIKGTKRFRNMNDRLPGWRNRSYLFKASLPDGVSRRLTAGEMSTAINSISSDGTCLLFSRSVVDYTKRPYFLTQLYSLDLLTLEPTLLWAGPWINSAQWLPEGNGLLVLGGPSAFGESGINLSRGLIPNEYDGQAYFFDPETKKADPISRDFAPSIEEAFIDAKNGSIYFLTGDRSFRRLYRYDVRGKNFVEVFTGTDYIHQFAAAADRPIALYTGSGANSPMRTFLIQLSDYTFRIFNDSEKETFGDVSFGQVEDWTFKNKKGTTIEGRIYYPPDFDAEKKYPLIVYYYGGTSPVTRDFGGRYPKNLWAANGYVVYVLQPSGATGFGQEFSSMHVNDWGIVAADEIILGTTKFLDSHSFIDAKRIGCIGASYGGFMTMLIQTRTNLFSAAAAHAGISSIASYWGEGYWGHLYNAVSAANSFPWNRKDIYVDQSPLFNADKISTPLLLLHGSVDTNVPPGESAQLFTALKLLGRVVEYIQIDNQDHHILEYGKRKIWTKTILAWFDKWLKGQPSWWASLYPD